MPWNERLAPKLPVIRYRKSVSLVSLALKKIKP